MEPLIKLAPQFRFLWDELQGPEAGSWAKFNKPYATAADAATAWDQTYERSGGAGDDRARAYAKDVFGAFNGGDPSGLPKNAQFGYNFLLQKGMTPEQAAGVTGRLMVESHARMDPAARNTLGGGDGTYGIAQWRGDRLQNLAAANDVSMDDIRRAPISTPEGRYVSASSPQSPQVTRAQSQERGIQPMAQPQKPQGLLAQLGMGRKDPNAQGQMAQPFYKRDNFKDFAGNLASGFNSMRLNPDQNLDARLAQKKQGREGEKQKNRTKEFLIQNGRQDLAEAIDGGMPAKAALGIMYDKGAGDNAEIASLKWRAENAGLKLGTPEYEQFIMNGGGDPATYRALEMQAVAAGYERGTPEFQNFMATRGAGEQGYARRSMTNQADIDTGGEAARVVEEGKKAPGIALDFLEQAEVVDSTIRNMGSAIKAIDEGAQSGIVYNMLPNITQASAELQNAKNRLGLDVIGSVTFGALSASEMKVAMDTAVPQDLPPAELRKWLVEKQAAQEKMHAALTEAALHFARGGKMEDYVKKYQGQSKGVTKTTLPPADLSDDDLKYLEQ